MFVNPNSAGKVLMRELASGKHHLPVGPIDLVTVVVDINEFVISADLLELRIGGQQWPVFPQADILDRKVVALKICQGQCLFRRKIFALDFVQSISQSGKFHIALNEWPLGIYFVRHDPKALEQRRIESKPDEMRDEQSTDAEDGRAKPSPVNLSEG